MWLIPSRGRPQLVERLFKMAHFKEPGILILDEDNAENYSGVRLPYGWGISVHPRMFLGPKLNAAFERFASEPWYGILNDDHVPVTSGWERTIIEAAGTHSMAWPDDNYGQRISAHVKGGDLCRALGWFACPVLKHYFLDDADELIAPLVDGKYLKDVVVSHEHVNAGRAPMDRTYAERPSNAADRLAFLEWKEKEWPSFAAKLKVQEAA